MLDPTTPDRVLAAVLLDARLQKEMRNELGAKADVYLDVCHTLATDSIVDEVIDYVEELVLNCTRTIARYNAKNYGNSFHIDIYGFDTLCCVYAPEFGRSSLFLSHEDAMEYVEKEFGGFGIGKVRVYVGHPSRLKVQTQPKKQRLTSSFETSEQQMDYWAKAHQDVLSKMRASGHTVTELEPSDTKEFVATFPQGRRPVAQPHEK